MGAPTNVVPVLVVHREMVTTRASVLPLEMRPVNTTTASTLLPVSPILINHPLFTWSFLLRLSNPALGFLTVLPSSSLFTSLLFAFPCYRFPFFSSTPRQHLLLCQGEDLLCAYHTTIRTICVSPCL